MILIVMQKTIKMQIKTNQGGESHEIACFSNVRFNIKIIWENILRIRHLLFS